MLVGFHHMTAIAGDPRRNLEFYTGFLGLRLVKRTVNFDDPATYHFYYGDERGTLGSLLTFFPWASSARKVRRGAGQISGITLAASSVDEWRRRAAERGVGILEEAADRLTVADPDGLPLTLVPGPLPGGRAITICEAEAGSTGTILKQHLGFEEISEHEFCLSNGEARVKVIHDANAARGAIAPGGVHHVAFAIGSLEEQGELRERLMAAGFKVSLRQDRVYFQSIYFRQPRGVLFEIATMGPGFTVDEPEAELGGRLCLPPWLEPMRESIEARLPPFPETDGG